jgi:hypothetical protein
MKRIKRQATDWEEIFANYIFDKRIEPRRYKEVKIQT